MFIFAKQKPLLRFEQAKNNQGKQRNKNSHEKKPHHELHIDKCNHATCTGTST